MKITKTYLKKLIKEQLATISENAGITLTGYDASPVSVYGDTAVVRLDIKIDQNGDFDSSLFNEQLANMVKSAIKQEISEYSPNGEEDEDY